MYKIFSQTFIMTQSFLFQHNIELCKYCGIYEVKYVILFTMRVNLEFDVDINNSFEIFSSSNIYKITFHQGMLFLNNIHSAKTS